MIIADDIRSKVTKLFAERADTLASYIGIEYLELSKDRVVASMPVDSRTKQSFGLLHGGASVALAETIASIGGWLNVDETTIAVVGLEINANHIRALRDGKVIGVATPEHRGDKTQVWAIRISSEDGKLVCLSRCTLANVPLALPSRTS